MSSIIHTNKVDAIGVDQRTGIVILKIFDHLDWEDENNHLLMLQNKINNYLKFMESNEVLEAYPDAKNKKMCIDICFKFSPTSNCIRFIDTAAKIISDAGFNLIYSIDKV